MLGPCRIYSGTLDDDGYGVLPKPVHGTRRAHRAALAETLGRPVRGVTRHRCHVRACIEPGHLVEGSQAQNVEDTVQAGHQRGGRRDQACCKWGHELTPDNVQTYEKRSARGVIVARRCIKCRQRQTDELAERRRVARHDRGLLRTGGNYTPKRRSA